MTTMFSGATIDVMVDDPPPSRQVIAVESPAGRRRRYAVRVAMRSLGGHELYLIEGLERQLNHAEDLVAAHEWTDHCGDQACTVKVVVDGRGDPIGVSLHTTSAAALKIYQFYQQIGAHVEYGGSHVDIRLDRQPR